MSLANVIAAVSHVLRDLPGVDQVLDRPVAKLPDDRCFLVFADPGEAKLMANAGRLRNAVYQADDDVMIVFAMKTARDALMETEPDIRTMLSLTRDALISALQRNALDGTVIAFHGLRTDAYGNLSEWFADTVSGFQMALRIQHSTEATSGRAT